MVNVSSMYSIWLLELYLIGWTCTLSDSLNSYLISWTCTLSDSLNLDRVYSFGLLELLLFLNCLNLYSFVCIVWTYNLLDCLKALLFWIAWTWPLIWLLELKLLSASDLNSYLIAWTWTLIWSLELLL